MANSATLPGNIQDPTGVVQTCANALCDALCEAIKNKQTSNEMEDDCNNNKAMQKLGLKFRTFGWLKASAAVAARFSRKAVDVVTKFGYIKLLPDALLLGTATLTLAPGAAMAEITGKVYQCFEIKLPNDTVGRGMKYADQLVRQKQMAGGRPPVVIACPGEPNHGVCTSCKEC